jgi:hypothetical protein
MNVIKSIILSLLIPGVFVVSINAHQRTKTPDLSKVPKGKKWKFHNRSVAVFEENGKIAIRFDSRPLDGVGWLEGYEFGDGVIEFDVRGKDVLQRSFVGIAFHGVDEGNFDAVYFRPFNFKNKDAARQIRAVQYESLPANDWKKLRETFPGKYEKAVSPIPDPNGWFHVRVIVEYPRVSVFVNDAKEPSLQVEQLSTRRKGWVGFFVGDNSDGDFANLQITRNL